MRKLLKILNIILTVILIFLVGFLIGKRFDFAWDENDELVGLQYSSNEQKIRRLVSLIDSQYVDDINSDSLVDNAINYILSNLDPHTTYLNKDVIERVQEEMSGVFVGLGVQYKNLNDTLMIARIIDESVNKDLLKRGDYILSIDEQSIIGKSTDEVAAIFRGEINSTLEAEILRDGKKYKVELKRMLMPLESVTATNMLNDSIGYIKLIRFGERSADEVNQSLEELKKQGMKSLVLDLRANPGGIMNIAETIADEFLTKNELIVFTEDKDEKKKYTYATSKGIFEKGKTYVLIDEGSASASEILAGALQEYGRGTIVGRRSYGKGLVQREINLGDGTRVRLTVARYYTPSGRSIQRSYDKGKQAYADEIYDRLKNGELYTEDSIKVDKSLKYKAPSGKTVYGGGGIVPDVFIPLDTLELSNWLIRYGNSNVVKNFIYQKIEEYNYHPLTQTETLFIKYFDSEEIYNQYAKILGVNEHRISNKNKKLLKRYVKALMAGQLFGNRSFYKIWISEDNMIKKILELENEKKENELE